MPEDVSTDIAPYHRTPNDLLGKVSYAALAVWGALDSFANTAGECWPHQDTVAQRAGMTTRHLKNCVHELEESGRLIVSREPGKPNRYRLVFARLTHEPQFMGARDDGGTTVPPQGNHSSPDGGTTVPPPIKGVNKNQLTKPLNQPSPASGEGGHGGSRVLIDNTPDQPADEPVKKTPKVEEQFTEFYAAYPRKTAKKAARRAWAKLKAEERSRAVEASKAYRAAIDKWPSPDRQYIPHPATWLNSGRYDDDPAEWQRNGNGRQPHDDGTRISPSNERGRDHYLKKMRGLEL